MGHHCWNIVNWTLGNKLHAILINVPTFSFKKIRLKMLITLSWPQRVKRVYYTITKTIQLFFLWRSNSKLILHNNRIHRKYINILSNQSEWEAPKHCLTRFAMIQVCRWYFYVANYAHGHLCMNFYMNGYLNIGLKLSLAKFSLTVNGQIILNISILGWSD